MTSIPHSFSNLSSPAQILDSRKQTDTSKSSSIKPEHFKRLQELRRRREEVKGSGVHNPYKSDHTNKSKNHKRKAENAILYNVVSGDEKQNSYTSQGGDGNNVIEQQRMQTANETKSKKQKWLICPLTSTPATPQPLPQSIAKYMFMDSQFKGVDHGRLNPKSSLEKRLDQAISNGDFDLANQLSDEISQQNYEKMVKDAIERKEFSEAKQREEAARARRKKPKLKWGFESKQRWETKSNM